MNHQSKPARAIAIYPIEKRSYRNESDISCSHHREKTDYNDPFLLFTVVTRDLLEYAALSAQVDRFATETDKLDFATL